MKESRASGCDCYFGALSIDMADGGPADVEHVLLAGLAVNYDAPLAVLNEIAQALRRPCVLTTEPTPTSELAVPPLMDKKVSV